MPKKLQRDTWQREITFHLQLKFVIPEIENILTVQSKVKRIRWFGSDVLVSNKKLLLSALESSFPVLLWTNNKTATLQIPTCFFYFEAC